ncbi:MAG: hypothetical protein KIS66_07270 [Fimbriimonadaceae bacterium]|nr:hypothetical protein [Fimbriimonadaceae bacterium]
MSLGRGKGGRSQDMFYAGAGDNAMEDQEQPGAGKTTPTQVRGQRRNEGEETFVEIKAPTALGTRSSVPYLKVLPKYRTRMESAIDKKEIPKEHEKRVREYFEGLSRG